MTTIDADTRTATTIALLEEYQAAAAAALEAGEAWKASPDPVFGDTSKEAAALEAAIDRRIAAQLALMHDEYDEEEEHDEEEKHDEDHDECEGGKCRRCGTAAELRTCERCGDEEWIIDCGCYPQPRPLSASPTGEMLCDDCAES